MAKKPLRISDDDNDLQTIEFGDTELAGIGGLDLENLGSHIIQRSGNDMLFEDVAAGGPWTLNQLLGTNQGVGVGSVFAIQFGDNGSALNSWLSNNFNNVDSNNTPFVSPFTGEIFAYSFTNKNNSVETDIEIYKNGITAGFLEETLEIRNSHVAWGEPSSVIAYAPGDRIHVFARDKGTNLNDGVITLWFKITASAIGSGSTSSI